MVRPRQVYNVAINEKAANFRGLYKVNKMWKNRAVLQTLAAGRLNALSINPSASIIQYSSCCAANIVR